MLLLSFNLAIPIWEYPQNTTQETANWIASLEHSIDRIVNQLDNHSILVTFFVELSVINPLLKTLKKLANAGHEIALYNGQSDLAEIEKVKERLENELQKDIKGIRQKNTRIPNKALHNLGFSYVSNIESSNIGFVFRRLKSDKTQHFYDNDLVIIPESLSPYSQLPFNDYVFQVTPFSFYKNMILERLQSEDYIQIYMNAWQLFDQDERPFQLPFYKHYHLGKSFERKLNRFLTFITEEELATSRMKDYLF